MDDRLDRITESLQQICVQLESLRVSLQSLGHAAEDHEIRLRGIERWRNTLTPVFAIATFVLGSIFTTALGHWAGK